MKIQDVITNLKIDVAIDFCKAHARYFAAAGVIVCITLIAVFGTNGTASDANPMAGAYQEYAETDNEEITALIENYYSYYAAGDTDTLKQVATPISDAEVSYIQFYSQYIDAYQNIKVYTKRGIDADSYLCSVYLQIKFTGIDTPAAGLDFFYVQTNEDGNLYINNIYGSFNQSNGEFDMDTDIASLIATFEQQADVLSLQAEVQQECNEAMLADENLNTFVNSTLQSAIAQWASDYKASVEQAAADAAAAKAAEEAAAAQAAEEAAAAEAAAQAAAAEEANAKTMVTTEKVNVRDSASSDGNQLGQLAAGTQVTWYAEENGWAKIDYNGSRAYVKSEYLEEVSSDSSDTTTEDTTSSNTTEGETITLTNTVNIRSSMSETASKVAVAYVSEPITIYESYADGWSRVSYNGKEGYCKTEYLK